MPLTKENCQKQVAAMHKYQTDDPERWRRINRKTEAQKAIYSQANKMRFAEHGPRTYLKQSEFIQTSQTTTIGRYRKKAIKTGLRYSSLKGKFFARYYHEPEIPYRNEWDLRAFKSLDENPLVESWVFLNQALPYSDGKRELPRHMIVDFEVTFHDKTRRLILLRLDGVLLRHLDALRSIEEYCAKEKIELEVWTKEYFTTSSL